MVGINCDPFAEGVKHYITTQLAQDDLETLALAIPNLERVAVNRPTAVPGSEDYYHRLPESYDEINFGVCIEKGQQEHRLFDKYRNSMDVIVVDSITEYTCISNLEVYFEEGKTDRNEVTSDGANRCTYDDSLKRCIESLFTVEKIFEV